MRTEVDLDGSWSIGGRPHGGYLLATMAAAAVDDTHPHPMAVSAHYVSSPDAGPALVDVERLRSGRRVSSTRVRLSQDSGIRVEALVTSGHFDPAAEAYWTSDRTAPELAPLPDCVRSPSTTPNGMLVGHLDHVDLRLEPDSFQWALGRPRRRAEFRGWVRRDDGADAAPADLLVFADALPPVTFDLGLRGWVPTLELTVLLRGLPAPGWLRAVQRAQVLRDGWLDEECELWDSEGRLVAQARQLAGYRLNDPD